FFELHVQLENFLEQVGWHYLFFQVAGSTRLFSSSLGLLFQFNAFDTEEVLRTLDGIFQGPVRIVEPRTLFQAPLLFLMMRASVEIRVKLSAENVKLALQCARIHIQVARQSEESEVVDGHRGLNFAACAA